MTLEQAHEEGLDGLASVNAAFSPHLQPWNSSRNQDCTSHPLASTWSSFKHERKGGICHRVCPLTKALVASNRTVMAAIPAYAAWV